MSIPTYTLNDGLELPAMGLGTYQLNGADGVDAIVSGIQQGYRLIDSAFNYENEGAVGEAIRRAGVPREELIVTSKLPGRHQAYGEAIHTVQESLYRFGLDYIDLYLIHWPLPRVNLYVQAWQALIDLRTDGVIRSIGVSNFLPEHIDRIISETGVAPSVNQIERHPYWPADSQLKENAERSVRVQAWSPLGRTGAIRNEPLIAEIGRAHGKTPTQVILRWHVQAGVVPIPKASTPARQAENLDIFDFTLSDTELASMATLAKPDGRLSDQDPATYEEF